MFVSEAIVSFGNISDKQKEAAEQLGVACFSWEEFSLLVSTTESLVLDLVHFFLYSFLFLQENSDGDLPPKKKTDILTIMYTSGTTGEPKGVILSNAAFMSQVMSMDQLLRETDKAVTKKFTFLLVFFNLLVYYLYTKSMTLAGL